MRQRFLNMEGKKISVAGRGKTHKSKTRKAKPF
jgi:hypothetical protein